MSDQDTNDVNDPAVRRALDAWTPMTPPVDFADRVLAARTVAPKASPAKRAWWLAAPIAAVAMIALVLVFASSSARMESPTVASEQVHYSAANGAPTDRSPGVAAGSGSSMGMAGSGTVAMNQPVSDAGVATRPIGVDDAETDIAVIAGTSVTIHDPSPVTALHIDFSALCPAGAYVIVLDATNAEIARGAGLARAVMTFETGRWAYEVRCEGTSTVAAKGTIVVVRDAADRKLPKITRTVNTIDPDGRTWRVSSLYVAPDIRVKAPGATQVLLVANGVETQIAVIGGVAKLPALAEGTYTYRALAPSGPQKVSTLIIDFDHTAPQIYLGNVRSAANGAMILDGAAAPGWTLSIDGAPITIDKNLRFQATARGFKRIVIRAEHPTRGVHYFATLPITR